MQITELLTTAPLIPVIVLDDANDAVPLARALLAGGLKAIEITLRTPAALPAIAAIARDVPEMLVGAGTVIKPEQFQHVKDAGARYAVSPGATLPLLEKAKAMGMPYLPGVASSSDIIQAINAGFSIVKTFPTHLLGGIEWVATQHSVFRQIKFFCSGGITQAMANEYLNHPAVVSVSGTWFTPPKLIQQKDWVGITAIAKESLASVAR